MAADVGSDWVRAALAGDDLGAPMRVAFLIQLGERLGASAGMLDVVLAALGDGHRSDLELDDADELVHPRLARARRYRRDVRCFRNRR